jgi:NAD(P)H-nitrite reductase large subunit
MMDDDDELCLCFHVKKRKVVQFLRVRRPQVASQLSECDGAGTGCGWCRPFLQRLFDEAQPEQASLPDAEDYATQRAAYRKRS